MTDTVIPVADARGILGYVIEYHGGPDDGVVEAFTGAGHLLGTFSSRARAACEVVRVLGVHSVWDQ